MSLSAAPASFPQFRDLQFVINVRAGVEGAAIGERTRLHLTHGIESQYFNT
jgi:hypothetical protein